MENPILAKLEAARKELLDLGLRNPLLSFKPLRSRGLQIIDERSSIIYDLLVKKGKTMSFLGLPERKEKKSGDSELTQPNEAPDVNYTDNKLQTNEPENGLQTKLLNTYYIARTSIEEQGVNILYITLGMLYWYESPTSEEARLAPLILIPVSLERSSAQERFRIKYSQEDIGGNISLLAKMKNEFDLTLPELPESEDLEIEDYFDQIRKVIGGNPKWKVEADRMELGFFSFGKFMIYNDLDYDKWPKSNSDFKHNLLQCILGSGFSDSLPSTSEDAFIDRESNAHELFQVVDADSSQILAMLAVREGKNLIVQGPPGTGKSQTITNIIADAIGTGKRVLFVSEKMAALEVVKRRLNTINLGEPCLELHSHKANKRDLHQELKRVLELGKPSLGQLRQEVSMLETYRNELNDYCLAANSIVGKSNLTFHQVTGRLLKVYELTNNVSMIKVCPNEIDLWTDDTMHKAEAFAEQIQTRLQEIGTPSNLLFWGCELRVLLPHERESLSKTLQECKTTIEELRRFSREVAEDIGYPAPVSEAEIHDLTSTCKVVLEQPDIRGLSVNNNRWLLNAGDIDECLQAGSEIALLEKKYEQVFTPDAWKQDIQDVRNNILLYGQKWYRIAVGSYRKSKKRLAVLCKSNVPKNHVTRLEYLNDIALHHELSKQVHEHSDLMSSLFQSRWHKTKSDWSVLKKASSYLKMIHEGAASGNYRKSIIDYLSRMESSTLASQNHNKLTNLLSEYKAVRTVLFEKVKLNEALWTNKKKPFAEQLLIEQNYLINDWLERLAEVHQVLSWNNLSDAANESGFADLIHVSVHWPEAKNALKISLQKSWYEYLIEQAYNKHQALRMFERATHERAVEQFRKLDTLNLQYNRARVALKHWEGLPKTEAGGQVNTLKAEFHKKARLKPIRKIIAEAGLAIQAIKPVFMMSPMSIANFLPQGTVHFDLVIFDEASQVRPVDALGAILRGAQLVVVGDTKQLPPTSFFDSLASDGNEDDNNVTADIQSILGMCDAQGARQRMLRWHYRSRHESLINVSNQEFYENQLVVFPSPGSKHSAGLTFTHLKETFYDRGKTRTNPKEAEAVANAVLEHARKNPKQSLGVVAFSTAQRQAIQDILEQKRRQHDEIEPFFTLHPEEPFFIKNLENVQGDERDVIFISIGYGRTQDGDLAMSFGPLNANGGEKRLNVLITRAKHRCQVFANINADDIDLNRTKSYGVKALKNFLHYAEHGKMNAPENSSAKVETPFEDLVAEKLIEHGLVVRRQIGSNSFHVDIAIVDEENPGRYIIGIECDGSTYQSARSARDRNRLRQMVLENIGWRLHRIWSTDWFRNPEKEFKRVLESISKAREILTIEDAALQDEKEDVLVEQIQREAITVSERQTVYYELANLPDTVRQQEIHLHPIGKIATWITEIVKIESPVHINEVARRIADAAGVARIGARISEHLGFGIKAAESNGDIKRVGDFLWIPGMTVPQPRNRINLPTSSRKLEYISPEEICVAVELVVRDSIAIRLDDCVPYIAKVFGFSRVTEEMRQELLKAVNHSVNIELIKQDGSLLKI